jgi:hypothetical protein
VCRKAEHAIVVIIAVTIVVAVVTIVNHFVQLINDRGVTVVAPRLETHCSLKDTHRGEESLFLFASSAATSLMKRSANTDRKASTFHPSGQINALLTLARKYRTSE